MYIHILGAVWFRHTAQVFLVEGR